MAGASTIGISVASIHDKDRVLAKPQAILAIKLAVVGATKIISCVLAKFMCNIGSCSS